MEIIWSQKADETFDAILNSIEEKFTTKEVDNFVLQTYEVIDGIQEFPKLYPVSKKLRKVRKAVIHPHSILYYRIGKKEIQLLFFWDNRKNPEDKSR